MVDKSERIPLTFIGFLILFVGWFSIFTGFAGIILAEDFKFFIEIEDFILVERIIPAEHVIIQMIIRMIIGFFLVIIGNAFVISGQMIDKKFCRPCMEDLKK